jgi:starch synthase
MNVLSAAAEIAPLTKVGGLADVVRSLPAELNKKGHDVRVIVPKYGFVDYSAYQPALVISEITVMSLQVYHKVSVYQIKIGAIPVYLLSSSLFDTAGSVYGGNEAERFWLFCQGVCAVVPYLKWHPDVLHCHDWHTAVIPLMARRELPAVRTLFTIHNVRYQGNFSDEFLGRTGLGQFWHSVLPGSQHLPWCFLPQGILWADVVNTVSENFAGEILTPEYGCGMQGCLNFRKGNLFGICNGLGYEEFDPASDGLIAAKFSGNSMSGKSLNRKALLSCAGWKGDSPAPLAGMVSRMDEQKGIDLILDALPEVIEATGMRFIFLGRGKDYYEDALRRLESRYMKNIRVFVTYDNNIAHLIYAGADLFLMPSQWEPCGLGQMIAMRYGTVPVVRRTGGLADTVENVSSDLSKGSGFVFNDYSGKALAFALKKAAEAFTRQDAWKSLVERDMLKDFSWDAPAEKYIALYRLAMEGR